MTHEFPQILRLFHPHELMCGSTESKLESSWTAYVNCILCKTAAPGGGPPRGCNFSASKYLSYDFSSPVLSTLYIDKIHPFLSTCNSPLLINLSSKQTDGYRFMQWLLDIHSFPCWFSVLSKCKIQDFLNVPFSVTCINLPACSTLWNTCVSQLVLHYTTKHTRLCTKLLCKKLTKTYLNMRFFKFTQHHHFNRQPLNLLG
jgi:hypothetical protein